MIVSAFLDALLKGWFLQADISIMKQLNAR